MSGFFGILRLDGRPVEDRLLTRIAQELAFRGPRAQNTWAQRNLASCFAFMHTGPSRQALQQPVIHENRFLWGDIRLDGQPDLLAQLASHTSTSSELTSEDLLLMAWAKWGPPALERLIGDFSFALWDNSTQSFHCARDFVGPRPFYYSQVGAIFCFSNTLRILRLVPEISGELDESFIADFLLDGGSLELSRTVYRDIRRLPPGHELTFSNGNLEVRRFRKLPIEEPLRFSRAQDYLTNYRELLDIAVRDRMPCGPTSLYLSGGLDSSSVCATAVRLPELSNRKNSLKAFTLSCESDFDDPEPRFASMTAQHLGIAHQIIEDPNGQFFELADTSGPTPEPNEEILFAQQQRELQIIAAHSNVVLSGDGGDNVLAGQAWPYLLHLLAKRDLATFIREFGGYLCSHKKIPPLRGGFRTRIRSLLNVNNGDRDYPPWLNSDFEARQNLKRRWLELQQPHPNSSHPLHPLGYDSLHNGYWGSILETEDAGWNRVLLETRAPLLDLRILNFLLRLPPVPWCMDKELVRQTMKYDLPAAVLGRPKTPLLLSPLETCGKEHQWLSRLPPGNPGAVESFVNWPKWCETLSRSKGSLNWLTLRPACLFFWLKAVESK